MSDLIQAALVAVNSATPVPVGEWLDAALASEARLLQLDVEDNAVRRAAALAPLIASDEPPQASALSRHLPDATDPDEIHQALSLLTHVTDRNPDAAGRLLAQVEKELLTPNNLAPDLDAALLNWTAAVTSRPFNTQTALRVAAFQHRLLRHGDATLTQVIDTDTGEPDSRIAAIVATAHEAWKSAHDTLAQQARAQRVPNQSRLELGMAQADLQKALRKEPDHIKRLVALARADFGGNLAAAQALHTAQPHQSLLAASHALIDAADHLTQERLQLRPTEPSKAHVTLPEGITVTTTAADTPAAAGTRPTPPTGVVDPDLRLTREIEVELAGRRDVGVVAQAALAGDPQARELMSHRGVSDDELQQLHVAGETALAQMVVSVRPVITYAHSSPQSQARFDDETQNATIRMLAAARKWDPNHESGTRWLTMAFRVAETSRKEAARRSVTRRLQTSSLDIGTVAQDVPAQELGPEDLTVNRRNRAEQAQQLRDVVADITSTNRHVGAVLTARFGLSDQPPKTRDQIANELGMSPSSVNAHMNAGLLDIHERLTPPPTLSDIAELPATSRQLLIGRYGLDGNPPKSVQQLASQMGSNTPQTQTRLLRELQALATPEPTGTSLTGKARTVLPSLDDVASLPPHLAEVVRARFGLEDGTPKSYATIAQETGTSKDSSRHRLQQAMRQLEQSNPRLAATTSATLDDIQDALDRLAADDTTTTESSSGRHKPTTIKRTSLGRDL